MTPLLTIHYHFKLTINKNVREVRVQARIGSNYDSANIKARLAQCNQAKKQKTNSTPLPERVSS